MSLHEQSRKAHLDATSALTLSYAYAKRSTFVAELQDFIRFPSVSAQPEHADDLRRLLRGWRTICAGLASRRFK